MSRPSLARLTRILVLVLAVALLVGLDCCFSDSGNAENIPGEADRIERRLLSGRRLPKGCRDRDFKKVIDVSECKPRFQTNKGACSQLQRRCKCQHGIDLKWTGLGCDRGSGGCQCKGFCGYTCSDRCKADKECRWVSGACQTRVGGSSNATNSCGTSSVPENIFFIEGSFNYSESQEACARNGGKLASVKSQAEQDALVALVNDNGGPGVFTGFLSATEGPSCSFAWSDGTIFWQNDQTVGYSSWAIGDPSCSQGCVGVYAGWGPNWIDLECQGHPGVGAICNPK